MTAAAADRVDCGACDAVCCRLVVVLQPGDEVADALTTRTVSGLRVMARDEHGWCLARDGVRMRCTIYRTRPSTCRRFVTGGPYCRAVRAEYGEHRARGIPLAVF